MVIIEGKKGKTFKETVWVDGKRVSRSFKRKTDAISWKRQREIDKANGRLEWIVPETNATLSEVFILWVNECIRPYRSDKTIYEYSNTCKRHFGDFEFRPIKSVREEDATRLIMRLKSLGRSPKTINKIVNILKQVLKFALKRKLVRSYALGNIQQLPEPEKDFAFYGQDEIARLLQKALGTDMHSILVMALNTGMRLGEILGLKWDRVNLDQKFITCSRIMTRKGLQEFTKTRTVRNIGINPQLEFELRKIQAQRNSEFVISRSNGLPLNPDHFCSRKLKVLAKECNVRELRFHDLRHTFASQFVMAGGSIYDLQHILGHSRVEMTQRYAHLSQDHLLKATAVVGFTAENLSHETYVTKTTPRPKPVLEIMEKGEEVHLVSVGQ